MPATPLLVWLFALLVVGQAAVALAVAWLALEIRCARCGKIAPRLLKIIAPLDRMETFHAGGEPMRDYA